MASPPVLDPEQELHLQTAFLLSMAVDDPDPVGELKAKVALHNLAEYYNYDGASVKALLALSSNTIRFSEKTQTSIQTVQPTVFIAFSNSLRHSAHDVPGQSSMANFMAGQRQCAFPGAAACNVHGHALAALAALPLGAIFSLLGQGYKLVATGYKFGGVVAHLFAARVLLQLQQEVQMARQMGISLNMSLADNKVSSYAFGSPFFATSSMGRVLASLDLQQPLTLPSLPQRSLHTIWRAGDGSPAFFAAASELFTVAASARDAVADAAAADSAAAGDGGDEAPSPASISRTPQVAAVQEWSRFVSDGVDALSRCRSTSPSHLLARPLDQALLSRVCMPGGLFQPPSAARTDPDASATTDKLQQVRIADDAGGGGASTGSKFMARARGLLSARSRTNSVDNGLDTHGAPAAPPSPSRASSPLQRSPSRNRRSTPSEPLKVMARTGSVTSRQGSIIGMVSPLAARQQSVPASKAAARLNAWREGLLRLLQVCGDGLGERYAPVGQFWIVGAIPSDKDKAAKLVASDRAAVAAAASAAAVGCPLQPADGARAMQSSASWLSPGNGACLFARWEAELDELQKDLMEAFPWVSFKLTVEVRGVEVDRRELLRPSASLNLGAM